jgi:SAM-dependent methyltransferase
LLYTSPLPRDEDIPSLYPANYGAYNPEGAGAARLSIYHRQLARRLSGRQSPSKLRTLDIGCGEGSFLTEMHALGWNVQGVEMSEDAAEKARGRGIPVVCGMLDRADFPPASFDLITGLHVLEHLPHPRAAVRQAEEWLRPGGRLFLALPNHNCWERRVFGTCWSPWDLPRHLYHFELRTLSRLLGEEGLSITRARYMAGLYVLQSLRMERQRFSPQPQPVGDRSSAGVSMPREALKTLIWRARLALGSGVGRILGGEVMEVEAVRMCGTAAD